MKNKSVQHFAHHLILIVFFPAFLVLAFTKKEHEFSVLFTRHDENYIHSATSTCGYHVATAVATMSHVFTFWFFIYFTVPLFVCRCFFLEKKSLSRWTKLHNHSWIDKSCGWMANLQFHCRALAPKYLPSKQAARNGVECVFVLWFTLAPYWMSNLMTLRCPEPAAHHKAVAPCTMWPSNLTTHSCSMFGLKLFKIVLTTL